MFYFFQEETTGKIEKRYASSGVDFLWIPYQRRSSSSAPSGRKIKKETNIVVKLIVSLPRSESKIFNISQVLRIMWKHTIIMVIITIPAISHNSENVKCKCVENEYTEI